MREAVKITKVYRFEELSEKAQEKALEKLWDLNVDYEWWDSVYEDAENVGVKIKEFDIGRGCYCRGTFTQDELDVAEDILKQHGKDCDTYQDAYEFIWEVAIAEDTYRTARRYDSREAGTEYDPNDPDDFDPDFDCPDLLDEFRLRIYEDYRRILQEEYDYLTGEEAIRETIDANEYEFTEDGKLY